jgi:putative ABC transport system permease protein
MSALGKVVRAGVGRRRVQTLVITLTTLLAVAASVLAASLIVASQAPFDRAFSRQHGAHLLAQFDGAKVTAAEVAGTAKAAGVTATAVPGRVLALQPGPPAELPNIVLPPITVVGRSGPGGPVDDLQITHGRWATGPREMVVSADADTYHVGDTLTFPDSPGKPTLTVVGVARSISQSADAWVLPSALIALTPLGTTADYQMLYRFAHAATDAQVAADRQAIAASVPPGALIGVESYLRIKLAVDRTSGTYVPFVVAFGALGLCISILIIAVVVSGAVGAATQRIGILKALGFTPGQVVRAYVGQALIPGVVGTVLGVVLGKLLAVPALRNEGEAFGTGTTVIAGWIDIVVPVLALLAIAVTALVPARRAGRLHAAGRGRVIRRALGRFPLPRSVSLGLAMPFARPGRSTTMVAAVLLGTVGVTFGVGLAISLSGIQQGLNKRTPGDVVAGSVGGPPVGGRATSQPAAASAIAARIAAQPGTRRYFSTVQEQLGAAGLTGAVDVVAYTGDSAWGAYQMVHGRWFDGAGQAVVPAGFLKATGTRLGDSITLVYAGRRATVRLVGEDLDLRNAGLVVLTDSSSLAALGGGKASPAVQFSIQLKSGTNTASYLAGLNEALSPLDASAHVNSGRLSSTVVAMDTLAAMLTVMLVTVAGLGVLNTIVIDTRERVHDLGVMKALGMSPRQTVSMVITSVGLIGLVAGVLGVPLGMALHSFVLPLMGRAAGTGIPAVDVAVYHVPVLVPLLLGGVVIAVAGALLPAGWAARVDTATALRTE